MTGTAMTEEGEFREIYRLDVIEIPTNKPVQRDDRPDVVYKTEQGKFNAVIDDIAACHEKKGSRCWWALSPSKNRSFCPRCCAAAALPMKYSTPSITKKKPRS